MKVAVIGAGSWGTALAQVAAANGHDVHLWARREEVASGINHSHRNPGYLSDAELSCLVTSSTALDTVLDGAEAVLVVTPSKYLRETAQSLKDAGLGADVPLAICTKGVEFDTGMVPVQVYEEVLGNPYRLACLSGPNHAEEVVHGIPAATVVASRSADTAELFQAMLGSNSFRVYTSSDTLGVELCAAAKNVIAIAVGISYGLGFGDNTAAMLMTRGQAEMGRLVDASGGDQLTCMGLAGTGDLIATCMSQHSRNRRFGEAVAAGEALRDFEGRLHMVVEGAQACRSLAKLAAQLGVELPIADAVNAIVWNGADPMQIARALTDRELKPEFY